MRIGTVSFGSILKHFVLALAFAIPVCGGFSQPSNAMAITPPRLVIDSEQKTGFFIIKNNSSVPETYRFGWRHVAMTPDGDVVNLEKEGMDSVPGYRPAREVLRFSPRRTTLQPGEAQRVSFLVRRKPGLPEGEYRSHFLVERESQAQSGKGDTVSNSATVGFGLNVARAVPVYVMNGNVKGSLEIQAPRYAVENVSANNKKEKMRPTVTFDAYREGNRSVIGTADVFCADSGEEVSVMNAPQNFVVYAEANHRTEKLYLLDNARNCRALRLDVRAHIDDILSGEPIASLPVPK